MNVVSPHIVLTSTDMTAAFATKVGAILSKGDTLLLQGDIGAGKSFFARALIQSLQTTPEDVPSPTFTLVQTYETRSGEIWHADLYRLSDPSEADELGLYDAFTKAICLIEWPDRLGNSTPKTAVTLTFETTQNDDERCVTIKENTSELAIKLLKALS
jgi:tRNA threonylcarbamoyladenosine biosynthesis protein TsaE